MDGLVWNATAWAERFAAISQLIYKYHEADDMELIRKMRIKAYENTVDIVRRGEYLVNDKRYHFNNEQVEQMKRDTIMYHDKFSVMRLKTDVEHTQVKVENIDCLCAAQQLQQEGYHVAVLNMASRQNPGGGVARGSGAQEENLFRRTNLFQSLYQYIWFGGEYGVHPVKERYPMDRNYGGIYTPNAIVFRGLEKEGYPLLEQPYEMSFVTVAGMNRPMLTDDGLIQNSLVEGIKNKIRTIFRIGLQNGHDALVLGALGCGAFRNPPEHIAKIFHEVMIEGEFRNKYKLLYFAILEDRNSNLKHNLKGNFQPFKDEFSND